MNSFYKKKKLFTSYLVFLIHTESMFVFGNDMVACTTYIWNTRLNGNHCKTLPPHSSPTSLVFLVHTVELLKRPSVVKDYILLGRRSYTYISWNKTSEQSPKTTCLERPHYVYTSSQWDGLSRQLLLHCITIKIEQDIVYFMCLN